MPSSIKLKVLLLLSETETIAPFAGGTDVLKYGAVSESLICCSLPIVL